MKTVIIIFILALNTVAFGQYSISGGPSMVIAFGAPKPYYGLHLGVEIPNDDEQTLYGRFTYLFKQYENNSTNVYLLSTNPSGGVGIYTSYRPSMDYFILEGGKRYYFGDGYESGMSFYGSTNVSFIFNSVKKNYGDFDRSKYSLPVGEQEKGTIFNIGFGLSGGAKYNISNIGTIYGDLGLSYLVLSKASNATAQNTQLYRSILFSFSIGFRKDLY